MVLPWLDGQLLSECLATWCNDPRVEVMPVDNSVENRGVSWAWNLATRRVIAGEADWLILCSTTMRFGEGGGVGLLDAMEEPQHHIVGGIDTGWHYIGLRGKELAMVGEFDEGFFAYYGDSDTIYRYELAGLGRLWETGHQHVPFPFTTLGDAHSIHLGHLPDSTAIYHKDRAMFTAKWGSDQPGYETFTTPFNREGVDHRWLWSDELRARAAI